MKFLNQKNASLLLLAALAASVMASCGEAAADPAVDNGGNDATTPVTEAVTQAPAADVINWEDANLPVKDYGGKSFTICTQDISTANYAWRKLVVDGLEGEALNDAIFMRNKKIEDIYNIKIESIYSSSVSSDMSKSVKAGDNAYDAGFDNIANLYGRAQAGELMNWYDIPHINLNAQWWDASVVRDLSYHDKLFVCTGDISPLTNVRVYSLVFNKDLCRYLDLDLPYKYVLDGTWTLDVFNQYITNVNADTNGDGVMNYDDRWGYFSQDGNSFMMYFAGGGTVVEKDANGDYQVVMNSQRNIELASKALEISIDKNKTLMADNYVASNGNSWAAASSWFAAGGSLMRASVFEPVPRDYRSMDTDFGILPYPKFDDQQKDYVTLPEETSVMFAVPITANAEYTGLILESLAAESVSTVSVGFYDVCLNGKSVRDEESSAMLDIIFANKHFDIGLICNIGSIKDTLKSLEKKGSADVASKFASNMTKAESALAKVADKLDEVE
ncbi:MAG: extracellular solute-binding protein [Clostridia bacterium]|nr:extracellular solute-binding protein [Clostridia bacterium]